MRALFLTDKYPPVVGGAESYVQAAAEGLSRLGVEVTVATDGSMAPGGPSRSVENGVEVLRLRNTEAGPPRGGGHWGDDKCLAELADALAGPLQVVHVNGFSSLFSGAMVAHEFGATLVASLHEQHPERHPFGRGRTGVAFQGLGVRSFVQASKYFASQAIASGADPEKVHILPYGLDPLGPEISREAARELLRIPDRASVVCCVGAIYPRKGQLELARAFPAIIDRVENAHLLLAGATPDAQYLQETINELDTAGLRERLTLLNNPDVHLLRTALICADVVAVPSVREGVSTAALEAMQLGLPVVAFDVPGLSELITPNVDGILVPAGDSRALTSSLCMLLDQPQLRAAMGGRAAIKVNRSYRSDAMAERLRELYLDSNSR